MANIPPVVASFFVPSLQPLQWYQLNFGNLLFFDPDGPTATAAGFQFRDDGLAATSAYFYTPSNAHQPAGTTINASFSDFVAGNVWIQGGSAGGAEQFSVRVSDGTDWSNWYAITVTTVANIAPTVSPSPVFLNVNGWLRPVFNYNDANGHAAVSYEFWDSGTTADGAYFYTPANAHHAADTSIVVAAADLANVWIRGGSVIGNEPMHVRTFDGIAWGNWSQFTAVTGPDAAPVVTASNRTLYNNEWAQVSTWIAAFDPDPNDVITQYQFQDLGAGASSGYFYSNANEHHAANTPFTVAAANLGSVFVRGGTAAGSETLQVRAFDGTEWSNWSSFTLTTQMNTAPVLTHVTPVMAINGTALESAMLGYTDANGHAATQYEFYDGRSDPNSAYFYSASNAHYAANTSIVVSAAEYASFGLHAGARGGTDNMFVRAFDGLDWSEWRSFNAITINQAPTATIADHTLYNNQWQQVSPWLSYSDPTGTPATRYEFWDQGTGATSGYFYSNASERHAAGAGQSFIVEAANLGSVWVRGGTAAGSETMRVRAFDGEVWSAWDDFTLTTQMNTRPTFSTVIVDFSVDHTHAAYSMNLSSLYSDAEGQAATQWEFWDGGVAANSSYFSSSANSHWGADQSILIVASDIASAMLHVGAAGSSDTMFYRVSDGLDWSQWQHFTITST